MNAMMLSPTQSSVLKTLLEKALTSKISDCEMFMKGIDYSYYYEENVWWKTGKTVGDLGDVPEIMNLQWPQCRVNFLRYKPESSNSRFENAKKNIIN